MELYASFQDSLVFVISVLVVYMKQELRMAFLLAKLQTAVELEFQEKIT